MNKLNPEVKAKWLEALRSGQYTQTSDYLRTHNAGSKSDKHCCLGVLCELYLKEHPKAKWIVPDKASGYFDSCVFKPDADLSAFVDTMPPTEVMNEWAGVEGIDPEVSIAEMKQAGVMPAALLDMNIHYESTTLSRLNDRGATFEEIANIIDKLL